MLVKFCKPEHNLFSGCNSIRFGTIEYYRKLNPSFLISDPEEGVDTHTVDHVGGIPSDRETVEFLNSTGFFTPEMFIQGIKVRRTFPNCYVWCCKILPREPSEDDGGQFDPAYSSFYKIPNPYTFFNYMAGILCLRIKRENLSDTGRKILDEFSVQDYAGLGLLGFHGPVMYVEKKQGRLTFGSFETYAENIPLPLRPLFVKTQKYVADSEYRFAFLVYHKQKGLALPVSTEPCDADAIPIA